MSSESLSWYENVMQLWPASKNQRKQGIVLHGSFYTGSVIRMQIRDEKLLSISEINITDPQH
jgi:hypothetical protein